MNFQSIDLMGPEYVLMLGMWWGVTVILTFLFLAAKRAFVNWRQRQGTGRTPVAAASNHVDA